jgi:hypothetical protein
MAGVKHPATRTEHERMLRSIGESRMLTGLLPASLLIAAAAFAGFRYAGNVTLEVLCLFVGGCSTLVAIASWTSAKHLRHAAAGTRRGRRVLATLVLRESEDDDLSRHGILTLHADPRAWEIVFATPSGWKPEAGHHDVEAVILSDVPWPVLVYCDDGLMWPRQTPRRSSDRASNVD